MSVPASSDHASSGTEHAHHDGPPGLPEVIDEAGDTPKWVPITGLGLLALIAILFVIRAQLPADETAPAAKVEAGADEAAAEEPAH